MTWRPSTLPILPGRRWISSGVTMMVSVMGSSRCALTKQPRHVHLIVQRDRIERIAIGPIQHAELKKNAREELLTAKRRYHGAFLRHYVGEVAVAYGSVRK